MPRRLAITGAGGFVGRHLARGARQAGWDVVGIVRSVEAAQLVAEGGARPVVVSGLHTADLAAHFTGAAAVVHLAHIGRERAGATYEAVNVEGTRRVLAAAREAGAEGAVLFSGLGVARYGMARRTTNAYFLSKLAAEVELFRSGLAGVVFRPSYIIGAGDGLVPRLLEDFTAGVVEMPGDGGYRMQPVAVNDAVAAVLATLAGDGGHGLEPGRRAWVFDLVGPEAVSLRSFAERLSAAAAAAGRPHRHRIERVPIEEADRRAASGGYQGMLPDELDCLLCDEVADPEPLQRLLGRPLTSLDDALAAAVRAATRP